MLDDLETMNMASENPNDLENQINSCNLRNLRQELQPLQQGTKY